MNRVRVLGALAATTLFLAGCEEDFHTEVGPVGRDAFANYVAVGTSVSMGVRNGNNAVTAESQITAWPNLVAHQAGQTMELPLFAAPGCWIPVVAPISFGMSQNETPANPLQPNTECAGLIDGVSIPAQNLAISGHTIAQATYQTPESAAIACAPGPVPTTATCGESYRAVVVDELLPPQKSQVGAMVMQNPTFVSVELGANDLLGALSGIVAPGLTVTPEATYSQIYDVIEDSLQQTGARVLLMGLPTDASVLPSMRRGQELYDDRLAFLQGFYVAVGADCNVEPGRSNHVFFARVLGAVRAGRDSATKRIAVPTTPPAALNCTSVPGVQDFTLTAADMAAVNALLVAYNSKMQSVASANGWAYATIAAPYEQTKPVFSIVQLMTGTQPFGPYISLDGVHPTARGQRLIANSAIAAINATYGFEIPLLP